MQENMVQSGAEAVRLLFNLLRADYLHRPGPQDTRVMNDPDRRVIVHLTGLTETRNIQMAIDADHPKLEQVMAGFLQVATLATHYGASPLAALKP